MWISYFRSTGEERRGEGGGGGWQPQSENEAADDKKKLQRSDLTLRWRRTKRTGI